MPAPTANIWLPGIGMTDIAQRRVDAAVQEYDENLRFGRNMESGQWCIFLMRRGHDPLPVIGFNDIPHPEDAIKRLHNADAQRRGEEILDEMNRHNEELKAPYEKAASEADEILAEAYEWGFRQMGRGQRSVIPVRVPVNRMGGYS